MEQALADVLTTSEPDTQVIVVGWETRGTEEVTCRLAVDSPWWDPAARRAGSSGALEITCRNVRGGEIRLGWRAGDVEDLAVRMEDSRLWPYAQQGTIFGNAPMQDPQRFLLEFADLLYQSLRTGREALEYLGANSFAHWTDRAASNASYLLLQGPMPLLEQALPLVQAHGVEHRLLDDHPLDEGDYMVVDIGESWLVCEEATVRTSITAA